MFQSVLYLTTWREAILWRSFFVSSPQLSASKLLLYLMRLMNRSRQMRILLDENFPVDFAKLLVGDGVTTTHVHNLGWSGIKNGELLRRAYGVCEVFVTLDRNLEFQQNIKMLPFGVVVVCARSNRIADLTPHIDSLLEAANRVAPGQIEKVRA